MSTAPSLLETLEERIAPATLIDGALKVQSPTTGTYTDADGDYVTVTFNKDIFNQDIPALEDAFTLAPQPGNPTKFSLLSLDLSKLGLSPAQLEGLSISVTADHGGNGLVNVGAILAAGIDLDTVTVGGTLGKIIAGDATISTAGVKSLVLYSLGVPGGGEPADAASVASVINGNLDNLHVTANVEKAHLLVDGGTGVVLGTVHIGGDLVGGGKNYSGTIQSEGAITSITIDGGLWGGSGLYTAQVISGANIDSIHIEGSITGGTGYYSAAVSSGAHIGSFTLGGSLKGGIGDTTGVISAKSIGLLKIDGDVSAGRNTHTGEITVTGPVDTLEIGGGISGSWYNDSGHIITKGDIQNLIIGGDVRGGKGHDSGSVQAAGKIHFASVYGNLWGHIGNNAGDVVSKGGGMTVLWAGAQGSYTGPYGGDFVGAVPYVTGPSAWPATVDGNGVLTVVDTKTATFVDTDGDTVTIAFDRDFFTADPADWSDAFTFQPKPGDATKFSLSTLDLSKSGLSAEVLDKLTLTILAEQAVGGNGLAHVGAILATGLDLGQVVVDGALGKIEAGDADLSTLAMVFLEVDSLGLGNHSDPVDFSTITSTVVGSMIGLTVKHNVDKAYFRLTGEQSSLNCLWVGGDLVAGRSDYSGTIEATGTIHGDIQGNLVGGQGFHSGSLISTGEIGSVRVQNLVGGAGEGSGSILGDVGIGSVVVAGSLFGDAGKLSGSIFTHGNAEAITIKGDIRGGSAWDAGIVMVGNRLSHFTLQGGLYGGDSQYTGYVQGRNIDFASVTGDLLPTTFRTANIESLRGGMTVLSHGEFNTTGLFFGLAGAYMGEIPELPGPDGFGSNVITVVDFHTGTFVGETGELVTISFNKDLFAPGTTTRAHAFTFSTVSSYSDRFVIESFDLTRTGLTAAELTGLSISITVGDSSWEAGIGVGKIFALGVDLGAVTIEGALGQITAGDGDYTTRGLQSLTTDSIGGGRYDSSTLGDSYIYGGVSAIDVRHDIGTLVYSTESDSAIETVKIGGNLTGAVLSDGTMGTVTIYGDLTGTLRAHGKITSVSVKNIIGGQYENKGTIYAGGFDQIVVDGDLRGNTGTRSGAIFSTGTIGSVNIRGDLAGGSGDYSGAIFAPAVITARLNGDLFGGSGFVSGSLISEADGLTLLGHGRQNPGTGERSGIIEGAGLTAGSPAHYAVSDILTIRNGTTATYTDVDGDEVTIKFNKKVFTDLGMISHIFDFAAAPGEAGRYNLESIDLSELTASLTNFQGLGVSVTAKKTGGDGFANVGAILGQGIDFSNVTVDGALGRITAGDGDYSDYAVQTLKVNSLGRADGSEPENFDQLTSDIAGRVAALRVAHDVDKAYFTAGRINSISIGGDIIGGDHEKSGAIEVRGPVNSITVTGSIFGGSGLASGSVSALGKVSSIKVKSLIGGDKAFAGSISAEGFARITIQEDLVGSLGAHSGGVYSSWPIGTVSVGGDFLGSDGEASASIYCGNSITSLSVKGDLHGGEGSLSGSVFSYGTIKAVKTNQTTLNGGNGEMSGSIKSQNGGMKIAGKPLEIPGLGEDSGIFLGRYVRPA